MRQAADYNRVDGTPYEYAHRLDAGLNVLRQRVNVMRTLIDTLTGPSLQQLQAYFRLRNIYNSNAIEGNTLSMGETELVINQGLTITGKPLRDSIEAKNLSEALDFFEELAGRHDEAITAQDLRNIHSAILRGIDDRNAGSYRTVSVKISGSRFTPPEPARIEPLMSEFDRWLRPVTTAASTPLPAAADPIVLACAAHAWFVYIHPFIDGNGRTARLLMNLILLRYGYPLTILTRDDRLRYYDALEESQAGDLTPFVELVMESALESLQVYEQAAQHQLDLQQTMQILTDDQSNTLRNAYELFINGMRLLKGYFNQVVQVYRDEADQQAAPQRVGMTDFSSLEFEKYYSLRVTRSAKQTWFFRLALDHAPATGQRQRYLFFFGFASSEMAQRVGESEVTLHVAFESAPKAYERVRSLPDEALPDVVEIGFLPAEQQFVYLDRSLTIHRVQGEAIARTFIEQALRRFG